MSLFVVMSPTTDMVNLFHMFATLISGYVHCGVNTRNMCCPMQDITSDFGEIIIINNYQILFSFAIVGK